MLNVDADIIPGVGAAGITIGQSIASILRLVPPDDIEQRIGLRVLKYGVVWLYDTAGVVSQICVWPGYRGKIAGIIGVGSSTSEVENAFGPLEDLEWNEYQVKGDSKAFWSGWCFSVEKGSPSIGQTGWENVLLTCICVSARSG